MEQPSQTSKNAVALAGMKDEAKKLRPICWFFSFEAKPMYAYEMLQKWPGLVMVCFNLTHYIAILSATRARLHFTVRNQILLRRVIEPGIFSITGQGSRYL